jgi:hypothetical protein
MQSGTGSFRAVVSNMGCTPHKGAIWQLKEGILIFFQLNLPPSAKAILYF